MRVTINLELPHTVAADANALYTILSAAAGPAHVALNQMINQKLRRLDGEDVPAPELRRGPLPPVPNIMPLETVDKCWWEVAP